MMTKDGARWVCNLHGLVADPEHDGGEQAAERLAAAHLRDEHADVWQRAAAVELVPAPPRPNRSTRRQARRWNRGT